MIRIEKNRSPKKEPENPKDKLLAFVAMPFLAVPTMEMQIAMVAVLTAITVVMCIATLMFLFAMKKNNEEEEVEEEIEEEVEEEIEDAEEEDEEGSDEEDEGEEEIPEDENVEEPAEDEEREEEVLPSTLPASSWDLSRLWKPAIKVRKLTPRLSHS